MTSGQRLKEFIEIIDIKQNDFSVLLNTSPQHITKLINGILKLEDYSIILYNLGCNLNWLFVGEEEQFANNDAGISLKKDYEEGLRLKKEREEVVKKLSDYEQEIKEKREKEIKDAKTRVWPIAATPRPDNNNE